MPASANDAGPAAHAAESRRGVQAQFPTVGDEQVGDFMFLEMSPQVFDGIELGGVRGQPFQPEAPLLRRQQRFHRLAAMGRGAIPDDQQLAPQMARQRLEECGRARPIDAPFIDAKIKPPEREPGDDRTPVPVEGLAQHRGLPTRRPRAHAVGTGAQSALVDEDDGAAFAPGFFFRRGHSTFFQWAMAASSRSMARRVGCWQLKPKLRKSRQT